MSYGTNAPQGLQVYKYLNGSTWTGQNGVYIITFAYAASLFTGDPVTLLSDGSIGIGAASLTAPIIGAFNGCVYTASNGTVVFSPYWPANTGTQGNISATAFVIDDPNVIFNIQVGIQPITQTDLNGNYGYTVAAGSTVTGQSGYSLDLASGSATTNTLKLIALTPAVNNNFAVPYNNGLVLINNHIYKGGTGTAGV